MKVWYSKCATAPCFYLASAIQIPTASQRLIGNYSGFELGSNIQYHLISILLITINLCDTHKMHKTLRSLVRNHEESGIANNYPKIKGLHWLPKHIQNRHALPVSTSTPDVYAHICLVRSIQIPMGNKPIDCTSIPLAWHSELDQDKLDNNQQQILCGVLNPI